MRVRTTPCYLHRTRPAWTACAQCGRDVCSACAGEVDGRYVCPLCVGGAVRFRTARQVFAALLAVTATGATLYMLGTSGLWTGHPGGREKPPHLAKGDLAFERAAYDTAEAEYAAYLDEVPEDSVALGRMGLVLFAKGDGEGARGLLEQAQMRGNPDPRVTDALIVLAQQDRTQAAKLAANEVSATERAAVEHAGRVAEARAGTQVAEAEATRTQAELDRLERERERLETATAAAQNKLTTLQDDDSEGCRIPVRHGDDAIFIDVDFDGRVATLVLDTGATATVVTRDFADRSGISPLAGHLVHARTVNGTTDLPVAQVERITIAGRSIRGGHVALCNDCALHDADGLLGMDVLQALGVQLDLPNGIARFGACP